MNLVPPVVSHLGAAITRTPEEVKSAMNMEHRTVLVTGADSGIGFAAAGVRPHDVELARRLWADQQ
jgi:hypothetical protein